MFSYYGGKSKIVNLYPPPQFNKIIEPFAGSARYALKYFENDVLLNDTSEYVYEVWKYLISVTSNDILSLPDVPSYVNVYEYADTKNLTDAEKYLIGFCLCRGKAKPRKTGHAQNSWNKDKVRIAENLYKVKHWKVSNISYLDIPNEKATWFIDPPYIDKAVKTNGGRYPHYEINYNDLSRFVHTRKGQVIACEGSRAYYLPFQYLGESPGTARKNSEYIYTNVAI